MPHFASALGISVRSAWKLVYERKVAHIKLGRRTLIPVGEIELIIARNTVPATTSKPSEVVREMLADGTGSVKTLETGGGNEPT